MILMARTMDKSDSLSEGSRIGFEARESMSIPGSKIRRDDYEKYEKRGGRTRCS